MAYLYGDLTPAPFTTNFLEELRDAVDFAAALADADQCVATAGERRDLLRRRADEERARIEALVEAIGAAIDRADVGEEGSPPTVLANDVSRAVGDGRTAAEIAVERKLSDGMRALDREILEARADYFPILERYLLARLPPSGRETLRLEIAGVKKGERRYSAAIDGRSDLGLDWTIEVAVPGEESVWAEAVRVDDIAPGLAISAPQLTGLIKKDVKSKKTKLGRHFVTKLVDDGATVRVELRDEIAKPEGFDVTGDLARNVVMVAKTGEEDDETAGTFEIASEDLEPLLDLAAKLRASTRSLRKKRLISATFDTLPFDGENVEAQPKLVQLVSRICDKLSTTVEEVARRSRADEELVLRSLLDDGRREEVFMPKERLRAKLAGLDEAHRDLFVGIEHALETTEITEVATIDVNSAPPPKEVRSEVPASLSKYPRRDSQKQMAAVRVEIPKELRAPVLELAPDSLEARAVLELQPASLPTRPPPPTLPGAATAPAAPAEPEVESPPPSSRTAELKVMLKTARTLSKEGKHDDAFRAYASLFASAAFQGSKPEDQRAVLRMMIHAKVSPSVVPSDDAKAAHKAALPALQALVVRHRDPADYEMLGMAYVILEEPEKAIEIFKRALEIERAKSPGSDLCGDLMRRVSQL